VYGGAPNAKWIKLKFSRYRARYARRINQPLKRDGKSLAMFRCTDEMSTRRRGDDAMKKRGDSIRSARADFSEAAVVSRSFRISFVSVFAMPRTSFKGAWMTNCTGTGIREAGNDTVAISRRSLLSYLDDYQAVTYHSCAIRPERWLNPDRRLARFASVAS
jgi:hypothetical protein